MAGVVGVAGATYSPATTLPRNPFHPKTHKRQQHAQESPPRRPWPRHCQNTTAPMNARAQRRVTRYTLAKIQQMSPLHEMRIQNLHGHDHIQMSKHITQAAT
jgi:hypothetical protein